MKRDKIPMDKPLEASLFPEVIIEENAPRDGLQNEQKVMSAEERILLIDTLSECGFKRIQIGSFVDPRKVPQMADVERVYDGIKKVPGVAYSALVLNHKGLQRALSSGVGHLALFVSASETHSRKNANCSVEQATKAAIEMTTIAKSRGTFVQGGIMNAFGCRFDGFVDPRRVVQIARMLLGAGADEINLADTPGLANPLQVRKMVELFSNQFDQPLAVHLHDTRGLALVNAYAAFEAGVRRFDSSCGGLGGCPFIPGAAGNLATEILVHLFESIGVGTGIYRSKLNEAVKGMERLFGRDLFRPPSDFS
jgi:hydroxymethylglutaryl-CoA lyase